MATINVKAERTIEAAPELVYGLIADMDHHTRFLPPAFSDFRVEEGGRGAGTITTFKLNAGRRAREYRMRVAEPEPGRVITESDTASSLVTRFTVEGVGTASRVEISTSWQGARGVGGFFERTFAPRVMRGIYAEELELLAAYAAEVAGAGKPGDGPG